MQHELPLSSLELIDWLNDIIPIPVVTADTLRDPLRLAEQTGKRNLVEMLKAMKKDYLESVRPNV